MSFVFQFTPLREGRRRFAALPAGGQISIHAPPRGATRSYAYHKLCKDFNSRPSARGDLPVFVRVVPAGRISIHAPPRGATCGCRARRWRSANFNSRPSARGDRRLNHEHPHPKDFNSRPSARGDSASCREDTPPAISIHAPPRGATLYYPPFGVIQLISIHAPPRGATRS